LGKGAIPPGEPNKKSPLGFGVWGCLGGGGGGGAGKGAFFFFFSFFLPLPPVVVFVFFGGLRERGGEGGNQRGPLGATKNHISKGGCCVGGPGGGGLPPPHPPRLKKKQTPGEFGRPGGAGGITNLPFWGWARGGVLTFLGGGGHFLGLNGAPGGGSATTGPGFWGAGKGKKKKKTKTKTRGIFFPKTGTTWGKPPPPPNLGCGGAQKQGAPLPGKKNPKSGFPPRFALECPKNRNPPPPPPKKTVGGRTRPAGRAKKNPRPTGKKTGGFVFPFSVAKTGLLLGGGPAGAVFFHRGKFGSKPQIFLEISGHKGGGPQPFFFLRCGGGGGGKVRENGGKGKPP